MHGRIIVAAIDYFRNDEGSGAAVLLVIVHIALVNILLDRTRERGGAAVFTKGIGIPDRRATGVQGVTGFEVETAIGAFKPGARVIPRNAFDGTIIGSIITFTTTSFVPVGQDFVAKVHAEPGIGIFGGISSQFRVRRAGIVIPYRVLNIKEEVNIGDQRLALAPGNIHITLPGLIEVHRPFTARYQEIVGYTASVGYITNTVLRSTRISRVAVAETGVYNSRTVPDSVANPGELARRAKFDQFIQLKILPVTTLGHVENAVQVILKSIVGAGPLVDCREIITGYAGWGFANHGRITRTDRDINLPLDLVSHMIFVAHVDGAIVSCSPDIQLRIDITKRNTAIGYITIVGIILLDLIEIRKSARIFAVLMPKPAGSLCHRVGSNRRVPGRVQFAIRPNHAKAIVQLFDTRGSIGINRAVGIVAHVEFWIRVPKSHGH